VSYPIPRHDTDGFVRLLETSLRRPALVNEGGQTVAVFAPDLEPAEIMTYQSLLRLHRSRLGLTPAEFAALDPDLDGLRAYVNTASPSAAQTVAATKALIRVLRAVLD
jgi:hypothetical protein